MKDTRVDLAVILSFRVLLGYFNGLQSNTTVFVGALSVMALERILEVRVSVGF